MSTKSIFESADLEIPVESVSSNPEKVNYELEVERFTERELEVPVEIINAPANIEIGLYPKTVRVKFKVSLNRYKQIDEKNFRIIVDFKLLEEDQEFIIPKLEKRPQNIQNLSISPRKIEYIIKK